MKPILLDTCILIDFSRGKPEAVNFIQGLEERPMIPSLVVAELYTRIKKVKEKKLIAALVDSCKVIDLNRSIAELGGIWRAEFAPSHGVGLIDALLAATARETNACLVTLNMKHFPMLKDDEKLKPY